MKKGNTKLFKDRQKLAQMLNLRRNGLSITTLAIMFSCDHTSISYICTKYGIEPLESFYPVRIPLPRRLGRSAYGTSIEQIISEIIPQFKLSNYKVVNGERINLGHSYADYIALAQKQSLLSP